MTEGRGRGPVPRRLSAVLGGADRLVGLDAARGLALLGMFVAHVAPTTQERLVDGRSAILFAVIAGMSVGLLTPRQPAATGVDAAAPPPSPRGSPFLTIAIRGTALLLLGLVLLLLRPPLAVILDVYGLGLLLLVPVLRAPRVVLAVLAAVAVVGGPLAIAAIDAAGVAGLPLPVVLLDYWFAGGAYPLLLWIGYLLVGLLLARCDLRRLRTRVGMLVGGAAASAAGYGAAALLPGVDASAHADTTAEALGSGGLAVALVAALLLLGDLPGRVGDAIRVVLLPIAAAGAMPLTLYVAHVLVLAGFAAANGGAILPVEYPGWLLPALLLGAPILATAWRLLIGRGPLEAGMRALARATGRRRP